MRHKAFDVKNKSNFCKQCGECCIHYDKLELTLDDIKRLSNKFDLSMKDFIDKYCYFHSAWGSRKAFVLNMKGGCPFYNGICTIYEDRPVGCRGYPFHDTRYETMGEIASHKTNFKKCFIHDLNPKSPINYDYESIAKQEIAFELSAKYVNKKHRNWLYDKKGIWDGEEVNKAIADINKKLSSKRIIENRCKKLKEKKGELRRLDEHMIKMAYKWKETQTKIDKN